MPITTTNFTACTGYDECAGLCPTGHYCLDGTVIPTPCPETTYRNNTGAIQQSDCDLCPAGFMCNNGTSEPDPCIAGHYCPQGTGLTAVPCPVTTYLNTTGASNVTDCIPCEKGYICNETGMIDYSLYPCPMGYYCVRGEEPKLCPAGRMRNTTGAGEAADCPLCRAGYYCPNDTINTEGIPCRERYYCPEGSALETLCDPGYYCPAVTGNPPLCPPGYYCEAGVVNGTLCNKPYYCPEGSNMTLICPLGYQALDHAGIRYDVSLSCRQCPPGTYGNYTDRSICETCPAGYYCPAGTGHGDTNICLIGYYCPVGSSAMTDCPLGTYGTQERAIAVGDCEPCAAGTYNDEVPATNCKTCGGNAYAPAGSSTCTCTGAYRNYQESSGSCVCLSGYVYFDETDSSVSDLNSLEDCQEIVDERCETNEIRVAATRQCVDPSSFSCAGMGGCINGDSYLDLDSNRCACTTYTDETTICDLNCQATTQPTVSGTRNETDGSFGIVATDPNGNSLSVTIPNVYGPSDAYEGTTSNILVCAFYGTAATGTIYTNLTDAISYIGLTVQELSSTLPSRRRLLSLTVPYNEITNPVMCVESGEMVLFKLLIDNTDRSKSHYPVYNKDHLFSTNPTFDFGAFTLLQYQIVNTNANITSFAHIFTEGGNYVFYDSQDSTIEILIRVEPSGSVCSGSRIKPATNGNILALGFSMQDVNNEAPDWMLIYGMLGLFVVIMVLLVVLIIIWLPKHAGLHPMLHWAPKYRSLGKPPPVPYYLRYDPDHWPEKAADMSDTKVTLGPRIEGDGESAGVQSAPIFAAGGMKASEDTLEDFNVRVLYDKLEDQNLHLASQLARQREDLKNFYEKICEQNEGLRNLLNNLDPAKMEELAQKMEERQRLMGQAGLDGAGGDVGPTIINASLAFGAGKGKFAGARSGNREDELMAALQQLLDRLNTGNLPVNKTFVEQLQKQAAGGGGITTDTTDIKYAPGSLGGVSKAWAELLRRQNAERLKLERELMKEEQDALGMELDQLEGKHKETVDGLTDNLAAKLQGVSKAWAELLRRQNAERLKLERELMKEEQDALGLELDQLEGKHKETVDNLTDNLAAKLQDENMSADEIAKVMNAYGKNLDDTMNKQNMTKARQAEELRRKLAMRRKAKEEALRRKQEKEAEEAGLPPAPDRFDSSDVKLKISQNILGGLQAEEAAGTAKLETDLDNNLGEQERRQLSDKMKEHLDHLATQGVIPQELRDKLLEQQKASEASLAKVHDARKQQQLRNLKEKMAQRRKRKLDKLRDEQEKYKTEVSDKIIEEGRSDELERELEALKLLFEREKAAAEAEMDAEENEHVHKLTKSVNEDHTAGLKETQRQILKAVRDGCPASEQVALQRLMDQHRKDVEGVEQELSLERDRQMGDLQAKLDARKARRQAEFARKMEEIEAQRIVAEQKKQMQQGGGGNAGGDGIPDSGLLIAPKVNTGESVEESAVRKVQAKQKEELSKSQKSEYDKETKKLTADAEKQEQDMKNSLKAEHEKMVHEMKSRHAAELAAQPDLNQDQINALMAKHQGELESLNDKLAQEEHRQMIMLRDKLAKRRMRKLDDLQRKHDIEKTREMLDQKKQLDEVKLKKAKEAERDAIRKGIKDNGADESEQVIKAVLAQRQAQEMADLDKQFAAEKRMMVNEAVNNVNDKYDKLREDMLRRHDRELADLQKQGLSPEELHERRSELLSKQQDELSALDRKHADDKATAERNALADWELKFAKAKLALKERHYKEFADALREFVSDKSAAEDAEQSAMELKLMQDQLEIERKKQEDLLKKEQEAFQNEEQKRMEDQMAIYARQLEEETRQEKEKHERNMESLGKRRDEIIKVKQKKMMEEVEKLKSQGASEEDQRRLLEQHEKDLQTLVNKIDAERLRMKGNLQERLQKKREEKLRAKQNELVDNANEAKRELDHKQQSQMQRMKNDEALTIQEALNIDVLTSRVEARPRTPAESTAPPTVEREPTAQSLPPSYNMAAPLDETELMNLLTNSPMYQKMENIKKMIEKGAHNKQPDGKVDGDGYTDPKDLQWSNDSKLEAVDLNKLDARRFVVYKFGCFVSELVAAHCQHAPVIVLLANKIPPNERLRRNPYRNSFYYDGNNKILYIRSARLDCVGEFVVVLVHTLAHIKSGDLRDDHNPDFLREYHRALAVVCDDLFFARFRKSTAGSIKNEPSPAGGVQLLQDMFGKCHTEDEKVKMVDDLLDVKLLPSTTNEGVHFNAERLKERLDKYSRFSMTNKLHTMLGSMEDKIQQSKAQGTTHRVDNSLLSLSQKYTPNTPCLLNRKLPLRFVTSNMTGHALWQTFVNQTEDGDQDRGSMPEQMSPEDKHDNLCYDFAQVNKSIIDVREKTKRLTEEMSTKTNIAEKSKAQTSRTEIMAPMNTEITNLKAELTRLEMEKQQIVDKINELGV